jgi:hypothetical protein
VPEGSFGTALRCAVSAGAGANLTVAVFYYDGATGLSHPLAGLESAARVSYVPPAVTRVFPRSVFPGELITIVGAGFGPGGAAFPARPSVGPLPCAESLQVNDTLVVCRTAGGAALAAAAVATGAALEVSVTVAGQTGSLSASSSSAAAGYTFAFTPPPQLNVTSPRAGQVHVHGSNVTVNVSYGGALPRAAVVELHSGGTRVVDLVTLTVPAAPQGLDGLSLPLPPVSVLPLSRGDDFTVVVTVAATGARGESAPFTIVPTPASNVTIDSLAPTAVRVEDIAAGNVLLALTSTARADIVNGDQVRWVHDAAGLGFGSAAAPASPGTDAVCESASAGTAMQVSGASPSFMYTAPPNYPPTLVPQVRVYVLCYRRGDPGAPWLLQPLVLNLTVTADALPPPPPSPTPVVIPPRVPDVSSVAPRRGPVCGGTRISITGRFGDDDIPLSEIRVAMAADASRVQ